MDSKRKFCPNDCNLRAYYVSQAGGAINDIRVFRGRPYQSGYGIGSILGKYGIPLLKFLGRHLLSTGMAVGSDLLADRNIKDSVKQRVKEGAKKATKEGLAKLSDLVGQSGVGLYKPQKRKRKIKRKTKRVKKDIFS